jgi:hypothetical protein
MQKDIDKRFSLVQREDFDALMYIKILIDILIILNTHLTYKISKKFIHWTSHRTERVNIQERDIHLFTGKIFYFDFFNNK